MKITAVVMILLATTAYSQDDVSYFPNASKYRCSDLQKASRQYMAALASENPGVVESALAHVAMMKVTLPFCDLSELKERVDDLATSAPSVEVRYKAFLVKSVMEKPSMFDRIAYAKYNSAEEWLGALGNRLNQMIAAR